MGLKQEISQLQYRKFTDEEIKEIQKFLRYMLIGVKLDQYIKIFNYIENYSSNIYTQRSFKVKELLSFKKLKQILNDGEFKPINLFYSVNTYKTYENSSEENLGFITNILIDIDYKKSFFKNLSKDEFMQMLECEYFGIEIPCPSAIIYTGNNFHITYKIKYPVNATDKAKTLARRIQKEISNKLSCFNADKSVNLTTSTRFIYTRNFKTMNTVSVKIYEDKLYKLRDLQKCMPDLPSWYDKWKEQKKKNKKKVYNFFNLYNLLKTRLSDLEKLQKLRNFNCHGYRELMCFLYRNFAMQSLLIGDSPKDAAKEAEIMMIKFNRRFKKPLIEKNIKSKTRNIERKQYNFKNEIIIAMLNITDYEQRELKTIISDEEYARRQREYEEKRKEERKKARRNEEGLTKKQAELKELKIKIIELREQKLSYREIASKLNISLGKVQRALKCNY